MNARIPLWRVVRPVLTACALLAAVSVVLFCSVQVLPGDAVTQALGPNNTPETAARLRTQLGLDVPVTQQYWHWISGLLRGDLGHSAVSRTELGPIVTDRALHSLVLAAIALILIALIGIAGGFAAGSRPGSRTDRTISAIAIALTAVPEFAMATVLIAVFAVRLGWFPMVSLVPAGTSLFGNPVVLVLPACCLALYGGAYASRMIRALVADVASGPSVEAARIAGLPESRILLRHVWPVIIGPIAQVLALLVPYLVGGALVVESVFAYPGLGALLASAITQRDAVEVADCGMILATVAVAGFVIAEFLHERHPDASPRTDRHQRRVLLDESVIPAASKQEAG